MSDGGDDEGGSSAAPNMMNDDEACKELNQEELLTRVRKMNEELEATRIPLHDVPVALVVQEMTTEKMATSWSRLCQGGGRASDGRHIGRVVRLAAASPDFPVAPTASTLGLIRHFCGSGDDMELLQQQRRSRALKWKDEYPRSRYRGDFFKPPLFDDEPSDSDEDESQQQQQQQQQHGGGGTSSSAAAHLPASDDVGTKEGK